MQHEPIRIRIVPKNRFPDSQNPRDAFWRSLRRDAQSNQDVDAVEAELCRELGPKLRRRLIEQLAEPLRSAERTFFRGEFGDLEHWLFRYFDRGRPEKGWEDGRALDALTRLLEQRQKFFRESPGLSKAQERIAAASAIFFSVQIAGYSSLNLDLSIGSLKSVAQAFENDFESFRIFLEAFIPRAFGDVFDSDAAGRVDYTIRIPATYEEGFNAPIPQSIAAPVTQLVQAVPAQPPVGRERAEWLWRLANGSLLVPLLLSLFVMWQGLSMLREIHGSQYEMFKPVLEHQLKLLEEDRHRLTIQSANPRVDSTAVNR